MLRLVPYGVHANQRTDAAAQRGNAHQCCFRYAPTIFSCFVLVHQHKQETQRIDYKQVKYPIFHKYDPLGGVIVKKCLLIFAMLLFLSGCGAEETMETISDDIITPVIAQMRQMFVELPEEAASPAVESGSDRLYLCENYEISIQTMESGDLSATIQTVCGYDLDDLTVMHTIQDGADCYEFVWSTMTEQGEFVGRAKILDDGNYHYILTVLGQAEKARSNHPVWLYMFDTFTLT